MWELMCEIYNVKFHILKLSFPHLILNYYILYISEFATLLSTLK